MAKQLPQAGAVKAETAVLAAWNPRTAPRRKQLIDCLAQTPMPPVRAQERRGPADSPLCLGLPGTQDLTSFIVWIVSPLLFKSFCPNSRVNSANRLTAASASGSLASMIAVSPRFKLAINTSMILSAENRSSPLTSQICERKALAARTNSAAGRAMYPRLVNDCD